MRAIVPGLAHLRRIIHDDQLVPTFVRREHRVLRYLWSSWFHRLLADCIGEITDEFEAADPARLRHLEQVMTIQERK